MQTVYETAGGAEGLLRLAEAWHARVMIDEVVSHAFSHGLHPQHSERLAAYWAEALGGPHAYSGHYGDETSVGLCWTFPPTSGERTLAQARVRFLARRRTLGGVKSRRLRERRRLLLLAGVLAEAAAMRARGYPVGGNLIVRCRRGHLFTTLWIPGASLKALRLGWVRFQWCPVGSHWSLVTPVKDSELTGKDQRRARSRHDLRLP